MYVRIELWPNGDREHARLLQEMTVTCTETTPDGRIGTYDAKLSHSTTYKGDGFADPLEPRASEVWREGRGIRHLRSLSPANLVQSALRSLL